MTLKTSNDRMGDALRSLDVPAVTSRVPCTDSPDLQMITVALRSALTANGSKGSQVTVVGRESNVYRSTSHSETLICRFRDGTRRKLFYKYEKLDSDVHPARKDGLPYEALVYRRVLEPVQIPHAAYCGYFANPVTKERWLFLEHLDHVRRLDNTAHPRVLELAARWLGKFQAAYGVHALGDLRSSLIVYGPKYYTEWTRRTWSYLGRRPKSPRWLTRMCEGFDAIATALAKLPVTVIHGEYTPHNVLIRCNTAYPIDWESAAIAFGEIDLAALTWQWPAAAARKCEAEYQRARWPKGAPSDFGQRLLYARLYWVFRWLGDGEPDEETPGLLSSLKSIGRQLGMIP